MVLVDSSVWINYFNGQITWPTEILDPMLQQILVLTGDLILTEALQGFRKDSEFKKARETLSLLSYKQMGGYDLAIKSAENYRKLRKTIDVIIGTFCINEKIPLLYADKDFDPMVKYLSLKTISQNFVQ